MNAIVAWFHVLVIAHFVPNVFSIEINHWHVFELAVCS